MSEGAQERTIESIRIGRRLRRDLGNLDELCESIRRFGLLQPITITPDGYLICGLRRLEACRRNGDRTIKVWVRSGLSDSLRMMLEAEVHENTCRMNYSPTEAAGLYAELKAILQEEAARNQRAHQFGATGVPTVGTPVGNAAKQAALAVTGTRSDLTHERVLEVTRLAEDESAPELLRAVAKQQLTVMREQRTVKGPYAQVKVAEASTTLTALLAEDLPVTFREETAHALQRLEEATTTDERLARAREAMARAKQERNRPKAPTRQAEVRATPVEPRRYAVRALVGTLQETDYWWTHYDPAEVAHALTTAQWEQFTDWIGQSVAFYEAVRAVREQ